MSDRPSSFVSIYIAGFDSYVSDSERQVKSVPRITPLSPPYEPDVAAHLESLMPHGIPPILLFRLFRWPLSMLPH